MTNQMRAQQGGQAWLSPEFVSGLVTVIVPTYNRQNFILETLESVLAQSYRPIELLVVDDGSTDSTGRMVEEWGASTRGEGFTVVYMFQENQGAPVARNRGVKESAGEFIQFLDSDDTLGEEKIAIQVGALREHADLSMVYGSTYCLGSEKKQWVYHNRVMARDEALSLLVALEPSFFCSHSPLFRRQTLFEIGPWDEGLSRLQDVDLALSFLCRGGDYKFCPEADCYVRVQEERRDQISAKPVSRRDVAEVSKIHCYLLCKYIPSFPSEFVADLDSRELLTRCLIDAVCGCSDDREDGLLKDAVRHIEILSKGTGVGVHAKLFRILCRSIGISQGARVYRFLETLYAVIKGMGSSNHAGASLL